MSAAPIRRALDVATEAGQDGYECDENHRSIAAATISAFLRERAIAMDDAHIPQIAHVFRLEAAAVDAAAKEGAPHD